MEPRHREILRKHMGLLCDQLVLDHPIVHYLYQEEILTASQVEEIESQKCYRKKTQKLLSLLPHRGSDAFDVFIKAIQPNFSWIADELLLSAQSENKELEVTSDQWSIPEHLLQRVPTDQQLNRLAALLGSDWEMVLLDLGLTQVEIDRCRMDHAYSSLNQMVAALVKWRQSQGRKATVQRLLLSLQNSELHPSTLHQVFV